jgi:hypothetical protein
VKKKTKDGKGGRKERQEEWELRKEGRTDDGKEGRRTEGWRKREKVDSDYIGRDTNAPPPSPKA